MLRMIRKNPAFALVAILLVLTPFVTTAHEHREVADGQYELTVGFLEEPAYVNEKNGLSLEVVNIADTATPEDGAAEGETAGVPVEELSGTLKAEVIYGEQSMELELQPVFN